MKKNNISNFNKVTKLMKRLRSRYMFTLAAHRTFMELDRARTVTYSGKRIAHKNAHILQKYNYFFTPSKEGVRYYLIIELAKFFEIDKRNDSLTLDYLLNYTEQNLKFLSKEYFKEYHKNKDFLVSNIDELKEITISEINIFRRRVKRNQNRINNVKRYRDEYIAHDDLKQNKYVINNKDIAILLRLIKDVVNFYYKRLEYASTMYDNFDKEPVKHTKKIFLDLRSYNKLEKEALNKKMGIG